MYAVEHEHIMADQVVNEERAIWGETPFARKDFQTLSTLDNSCSIQMKFIMRKNSPNAYRKLSYAVFSDLVLLKWRL